MNANQQFNDPSFNSIAALQQPFLAVSNRRPWAQYGYIYCMLPALRVWSSCLICIVLM